METTNIQINIPEHHDPSNKNWYLFGDKSQHNPVMGVKCRYTDKFYVYDRDIIIGAAIRMYGEYTQVELDALSNFINENTIVYDIGGNIGYHALGFSQRAKHVHTFEPNIKNLKLLYLNVGTKPNVTIHEVAVSDTPGTSYISDYDLDGDGNFGECMLSDQGQPCTLVRIDDMNLPKPHVVKIDVEGHELKVFNGMRNTIRSAKPVILYEAMHGTGFDEIYDFLHDELGYTIYWFPATNFNPNNFLKQTINIFGHGGVINCLAIPDSMNVQISGLDKMTDRNDTYEKFIERMIEKSRVK